jgi:hypothetical protein
MTQPAYILIKDLIKYFKSHNYKVYDKDINTYRTIDEIIEEYTIESDKKDAKKYLKKQILEEIKIYHSAKGMTESALADHIIKLLDDENIKNVIKLYMGEDIYES